MNFESPKEKKEITNESKEKENAPKKGSYVTAWVVPLVDMGKPFDNYRLGAREGIVIDEDAGEGKVEIKILQTGERFICHHPRVIPDNKVPADSFPVLRGERKRMNLPEYFG